jgi:DNA-binding transcriptional MerR regulator/methylmalonyl-CoA mutase cobalamin-binding subunit
MSSSSEAAIHPVRVVAKRTGLTPDLLRAWERRYGAVHPARTPGGQRHYTDADVERLRLLARATAGGRQIGQVAQLSNEELQGLVDADAQANGQGDARDPEGATISVFLTDALAAVEQFDAPSLERTLRTATLRLSADDVLDRVFGPLLLTIGTRWHAGQLSPAHEHLATTTIRRVLTWMTESPPVGVDAPVVVVGTPAAQMHDLGAMLAATAASGQGWRVLYLGANLPAAELSRAARVSDAAVIALSIVFPTDDRQLPDELRALRVGLPRSTKLVVGGAGIEAYAAVLEEVGARRVESLAALRAYLREQDPRLTPRT